eukprot:gene32355-39128_t
MENNVEKVHDLTRHIPPIVLACLASHQPQALTQKENVGSVDTSDNRTHTDELFVRDIEEHVYTHSTHTEDDDQTHTPTFAASTPPPRLAPMTCSFPAVCIHDSALEARAQDTPVYDAQYLLSIVPSPHTKGHTPGRGVCAAAAGDAAELPLTPLAPTATDGEAVGVRLCPPLLQALDSEALAGFITKTSPQGDTLITSMRSSLAPAAPARKSLGEDVLRAANGVVPGFVARAYAEDWAGEIAQGEVREVVAMYLSIPID